jgi:glycosyltransferase involved in cell wall biosynthesis
MKIAISADPEIPVPPITYGGIERIVSMLVDGLRNRGHDVVLFSHPDSTAPCQRVAWRGRNSRSWVDTAANTATLWQEYRGQHFDVVHSFSRIAYMLPLLPVRVPKIMSYQRAISRRSVGLARCLARNTLQFTAISQHMVASVRDMADWSIIFNGVPLNRFAFSGGTDADRGPLLFLGRVESIKGAHLAIEVAQGAGRPLIIAGNIPGGHEEYFESKIRPHLNSRGITYVGPVDDEEKNRLCGSAAALLMPILWDEPFGIVMAEALACGTPVIGLRRGSVPEIVRHGTTGFICDSVDEMVEAVGSLSAIDRHDCRLDAEARFSDRVIVDAYERLYESLVMAP